jgi:two-component system KDP operon response regulator KdpE
MLPGAPPFTTNSSAAGRPVVLVVEDEPRLRRFLALTLSTHGFHSVQAELRPHVLSRAAGHEPDLILLGVGQPGADAVGLTAHMRKSTLAPIVVVVNPMREEERAAVLDAGANDYLVKPFGKTELLGRVRVWLKQAARLELPRLQSDPALRGLRMDLDRRSLLVEGHEVHITPLDAKLLQTLAHSGTTAMPEERLLQAVWGPTATPPVQYLRARLRQLRQKIERDPARPRYLLREPDGRYRLKLS